MSRIIRRQHVIGLVSAMMLICVLHGADAQNFPRFDLTQPQAVKEWQATHDVASLTPRREGMVIAINGGDPYIHGPARDYPEGVPLWMRVRFKSDVPGTAQVFYFVRDTTEANSVRFSSRGGVWEEARIPMPPLGKGFHLRFDPPGTRGKVVLASIAFEPRILLKEPEWPVPVSPIFRQDALTLQSGDLRLIHNRDELGGFALDVAGERMAVGHARPWIGYTQNGALKWLNVAARSHVMARQDGAALRVEAVAEDEDGAKWTLTQRFAPGKRPDTFDVMVQVTVSQPRITVYLPLLTLLPGVGSFGESKGQGLFAGLEYLDNEPSSSEADIIGPGAKRQVPDNLKITFPLMAIQAHDRYIGLLWETAPRFSAVFDSPDRLFKSGGHLMGVLFPGSDGTNRQEGSLLPYLGETLLPNRPVTLKATLIGGRGKSVIPAVQQVVALRGLPSVPNVGQPRTLPAANTGMPPKRPSRSAAYQSYIATAAAGYLDSKIREGSRFKHAYPGSFTANAVADAPLLMEWLAGETTDKRLAERLTTTAQEALALVAPPDLNFAAISHVVYPTASLLYRQAALGAERAAQRARDLRGRFQPDGTIPFRPSPGGLDYGKTHFAPDANGLTGQVVAALLESAAVSGDPELIREGLQRLRALDKFTHSVPRGAQTWEVPLHTPDILASAHLVRAYTLGYELTGDRSLLDMALYWAWTGVPFLYLEPPTTNPIGLYATIPVLGATQWQAPNWMGLPVQWCGLVYADALYRLVRHDPNGPWKRLADGVTASGVQQTWPRGDDPERVGLLPDSLSLRAQTRNDAAINPGTLLTNAIRLYGRPEIYDFRTFRQGEKRLLVHAPGAITDIMEEAGRVRFTVQGWTSRPYELLCVGLTAPPKVKINGQEILLNAPHAYLSDTGRLILHISGSPTIEIAW